MALEIEAKFRCDNHSSIRVRLEQIGARPGAAETQVDRYFNHPCRDFAQTDEAVRIRTVAAESRITYKGPKLDAVCKTREEIELVLGTDAAEPMPSDGATPADHAGPMAARMLQQLGFRPVLTVTKVRQTYHLCQEGWSVAVGLDELAGLGSFCEIEAAPPASWTGDDADLLTAGRRLVFDLAGRLGLAESANERRSYLELLLEAGAVGDQST